MCRRCARLIEGQVPDFSYLQNLPLAYLVERVRRGHELSDEELLGALAQLEPAPLADGEMDALRKELDRGRERRGRPRKDAPGREALIELLTESSMPQELCDALVDRVRSGRRRSHAELAMPSHRKSEQQLRDTELWHVFLEVRAWLKDEPISDGMAWLFEGLVRANVASLSQRDAALTLTQEIARDRLGLDPPSIGRLKNIVSKLSREDVTV